MLLVLGRTPASRVRTLISSHIIHQHGLREDGGRDRTTRPPAAHRDGVLQLHAEPEVVAEILFSLGDGIALRMLTEPERDFTLTIRAGITAVRALLTD